MKTEDHKALCDLLAAAKAVSMMKYPSCSKLLSKEGYIYEADRLLILEQLNFRKLEQILAALHVEELEGKR